MLLRGPELDLEFGQPISGIGEEMRLAAGNNGRSAVLDQLLLPLDHDANAAGLHTEMLIRTGVDMHESIASARTTFLENDLEAGHLRIARRGGKKKRLLVERIPEPRSTIDLGRHPASPRFMLSAKSVA